MLENEEFVKDAEGGQWEITMRLCETMEEAIDIYGESGTLALFNSGLKVKKQNIARTMSKSGKSREEVEIAMDDYRPGRSTRTSKKTIAGDLIKKNADKFLEDAELKAAVVDAFVQQDWSTVITLMQ